MVAAITAVFVCLPFALRLLPGDAGPVGARTLLTRITSSASVAYSGFAESQGGVTLPVGSDAFSSVTDLFGQSSQLRVWWRGASDWRVDQIGLTGENDLYRDRSGLSSWDYEAEVARRTTGAAALRLPRADDLLPPSLARRLLSEVSPSDVSAIGGRRIAGERTAGLRVRVADTRSTIDHIDVWALPADGLPLRVDVYASGPRPVLSTSFLDVTTQRPDAAATTFRPPAATVVEDGRYPDVVSAIDQLGEGEPPTTVGGLPRRTDLDLGAVGVYGRGVTLLVAVPLSARLAGEIVPDLRQAPGAVENATGIAAGVGPLNVRLSPPTGYGARWLLVGTVTKATLTAAVADLPPAQGYRFRR